MEDQRHAHGAPGGAVEFGPRGSGRGRKRVAGNIRETDSGLLEHRAIAEDPGASAAAEQGAAAGLAGPGVFNEAGAAVRGFNRRADAVLQAGEVVAHGCDVIHPRIVGGGRGPRLRPPIYGKLSRTRLWWRPSRPEPVMSLRDASAAPPRFT